MRVQGNEVAAQTWEYHLPKVSAHWLTTIMK
jgi:hypothetical protein